MNGSRIENRTYAEIRVGDTASLTRTVDDDAVSTLALLTDDADPGLIDPDYARRYGDGRLQAQRSWTGALVSSLITGQLPGPGAIERSQQLRFLRPVPAGSTVTVRVTVVAMRDEDRVLTLECESTDGHGVLLATGTAEVVAPSDKRIVARPDHGTFALQGHDKFEELLAYVKPLPPVVTAVAHPCSESALQGVIEAAEAGMITPILVGPTARILALASTLQIDLSPYRLVDAPHSHASASTAVALVRAGEARMMMKGSLHTDELLGAVVARDTGLRTERRLSHAFVFDVPTYHKPLIVTDAAINIFPDLDAKRDICQLAIELAMVIGVPLPKVAILSAVETVNAKIPSTTDAASLCKMADRGQITGGLLDGPLAMDNAISREAAAIKGIVSEVAGDADILLVPDLEAGNILAKQLSFMAQADAAGVVLGARVPIVLTSRADSVRARLASCAIAVLMASAQARGAAQAGVVQAGAVASVAMPPAALPAAANQPVAVPPR